MNTILEFERQVVIVHRLRPSFKTVEEEEEKEEEEEEARVALIT